MIGAVLTWRCLHSLGQGSRHTTYPAGVRVTPTPLQGDLRRSAARARLFSAPARLLSARDGAGEGFSSALSVSAVPPGVLCWGSQGVLPGCGPRVWTEPQTTNRRRTAEPQYATHARGELRSAPEIPQITSSKRRSSRRDGLPRQADRLEGVGAIGVDLKTRDLARAHRPNDSGRELDLTCPAPHPTGGPLQQQDTLAAVDRLLDGRAVLRPRSKPVKPERSKAVQTDVFLAPRNAWAHADHVVVHHRRPRRRQPVASAR